MEKRHVVLFQQLEDYRSITLQIVDGVTEQEADVVPPGFSNNIRWNLGHIYLDQFLWIQHLTKEAIPLPDGYHTWFAHGTKPSDWRGSVPSLVELRQLLAGQIGWIREQYGHRLEEEFPATESGMYTIAQVLVRTIYHEALHVGTMLAMRRML